MDENFLVKSNWIDLIQGILSNSNDFNITSLDKISRVEKKWLWKNRIPEGTLTIIEGDGGKGKSTIVADILSRLSSGSLLPDDSEEREPMNVLLLSAEDDPGSVIRPRFDAHGAVLENILIEQQPKVIDISMLSRLAEKISENQIRVVVFDPIVSFLGRSINMNSSTDIRSTLAPLLILGRELGCTFIIVRHFNKSKDAGPSQRGAGSVDFRNISRSVLQVMSRDGKSYLVLEKTNYGSWAKTLPFTISDGKIAWGEPTNITAEELHAIARGGEDISALGEARAFLKEELIEPKLIRDLEKSAAVNNISFRTLRRASEELNIKKTKTSLGWEWSLGTQDGQGDQIH